MPRRLELLLVLKKAKIVIGNDSGIMHLASLMKTKLLSIWGYTNYKNTAPVGSSSYIIRKKIKCSPCYKVLLPVHCIYKEKKWLTNIKVNDVWNILDKIMSNKKIRSVKMTYGTNLIDLN